MARTHEVPNHLNVEDTLFLGLTARQVATFMAFASPAYGIWDQLTVAPMPVRGALAGLLLLLSITREWSENFVYAACWRPSAAERWSRAVSTSR